MKYHVNAKGEAGVCKALQRPCPINGKHYETLDEAQFASELNAHMANKALRKTQEATAKNIFLPTHYPIRYADAMVAEDPTVLDADIIKRTGSALPTARSKAIASQARRDGHGKDDYWKMQELADRYLKNHSLKRTGKLGPYNIDEFLEQSAAENALLRGEKPKPIATNMKLKLASKQVVKQIENSIQAHQFIRALMNDHKPEVHSALTQLGVEELDAYHKFDALKLISERYFDEHQQQLDTLPSKDAFSLGIEPAAGSDEEQYGLIRQTLDSSVKMLARVRLLTHPDEPRGSQEQAYIAAQGEMTQQMVVEKVKALEAAFYTEMREKQAFMQLMNL